MLGILDAFNGVFDNALPFISWIAFVAMLMVVVDFVWTSQPRIVRLAIGFLFGVIFLALLQGAYWLCLQGNPHSPTQALACQVDM